MEIYLTIQRW